MTIKLNNTIETELNNRYNELSEMNLTSNWTKEMEIREDILDEEIRDLQEAKLEWDIKNN